MVGRNGSKTYAKTFSLISDVENANSNHREIAFHTHQVGRLVVLDGCLLGLRGSGLRGQCWRRGNWVFPPPTPIGRLIEDSCCPPGLDWALAGTVGSPKVVLFGSHPGALGGCKTASLESAGVRALSQAARCASGCSAGSGLQSRGKKRETKELGVTGSGHPSLAVELTLRPHIPKAQRGRREIRAFHSPCSSPALSGQLASDTEAGPSPSL